MTSQKVWIVLEYDAFIAAYELECKEAAERHAKLLAHGCVFKENVRRRAPRKL